MGIRRILAVNTAKIIKTACQAAGKQGVTLAGKIAMKLDPSILAELASQVREGIFVTCGTNGKTTTNNLLCSAIRAEGKKVVCNHTGSNMLNGVVSAFVLSAKWNGKLDADYACIEIDEASTVRVFPYFKPDFMVLTNLFRDQLDRYGEIDITMNLLKKAMQMAPDMKVIVNGDDALSAYLAKDSGNAHVFFGIGDRYFREENAREIREGRFCKRCGERLIYHFYHYSQLGDYECPKCGFKRPWLDFNAKNILCGGKLGFTVDNFQISANYRGFYNIYNILAAYAAGKTAGLALKNYNKVLAEYNPQNGRMEEFRIGDTEIVLNLAKNPAGFNQNISAVMEDNRKKDIIVLINDNSQDGTDISWLWDVDFERFKDINTISITVSGIRCQDMRLRLKYVGIASRLEPDVEEAIRDRIAHGAGNLYVLVNYTALYDTHNILKKIEGEMR
ncbi:MurT ligase domain-containing protein [Hominisplanchenecus murintestinalis]|uniref:MurT ligase domain-containing protein n=1 Tax=Hominisplanchenecus murintestinalis TaxID=2941517 RepID=UPI00203DE41B|nr:MurT ligase domain-containing protein [Hominisplanchenecus murintestinalis]